MQCPEARVFFIYISHVAILAISIAHIAWRSHKIAIGSARSNHDLCLLGAPDRRFLADAYLGGRPLDRRYDGGAAGRAATIEIMVVVLEAQLVLPVDVLDATGRPLRERVLAAGCYQAGLVAAAAARRRHLKVRRRPLQVDNPLIVVCSGRAGAWLHF